MFTTTLSVSTWTIISTSTTTPPSPSACPRLRALPAPGGYHYFTEHKTLFCSPTSPQFPPQWPPGTTNSACPATDRLPRAASTAPRAAAWPTWRRREQQHKQHHSSPHLPRLPRPTTASTSHQPSTLPLTRHHQVHEDSTWPQLALTITTPPPAVLTLHLPRRPGQHHNAV